MEENFKYYSPKTKGIYDTKEEYDEAVKKYDEEQAKIEKEKEVKKEKAEKVKAAYRNSVEARKAAAEMIRKADEDYVKLRNDFIDEYGSWHMSYNFTSDDCDNSSDVFSGLIRILEDWNNI